MKHFSYLTPALPRPSTPHAKKCMEKIREILASQTTQTAPEKVRVPGQDDEEKAE